MTTSTETLVLADYETEIATAQAKGGSLSSRVVQTTTFTLADYAAELEHVDANQRVGLEVIFENARLRIWQITLEPGERVPFHCHLEPYFWVCVSGSLGAHRENDGSLQRFDFHSGDVDFLPIRRGEEKLIHDLENIGTGQLRFITVELLD